VGQGTTVCVYLPRFVGEAVEDETEGNVTALETGHGETVLLIDDEDAIRMLIGNVLARQAIGCSRLRTVRPA
jgi:hypothetical protein